MDAIDIYILNSEPIMKIPNWLAIVLIISFISLIIFIVIILIMSSKEIGSIETRLIIFYGLLVSVVSIMLCALACKKFKYPSGRYRYEVYMSKAVSISEIYDRYDVIEQRGEIWVIEDKK